MSNIKARIRIERTIINAFIKSALKAGHRLSVSLERGYDLEEGSPLLGSRDRKALLDEALAGDDCHIFVHDAEGPLMDGSVVISKGWVYCVRGNDGWDVISDYTTNLEPLLEGANRLADKYSN